jgi:phosphate transport system substrate-binding protein
MRKRDRWAAFVGAVAVLAIVAVACGGGDDGSGGGGTGDPAASGPSGLSGSVVVSGSSTVQPISTVVAETFNETNPDVQISVDGPGTGDGFALFCNGETDISDASRPIEDEEAANCDANGINYVELEIGLDGITVMTNPANADVTCLNEGDLYALFGPESDGFASWSDANDLASEVGGNGNFPDAPLEITAPGEESGTYDAFIELAGIESTATERGLSEDEAAALRQDYQPSPDDNVIIQAMEGSDTARGFVGLAYAEQAGDQIKEIQVDGGSGCIEPSAETVADGTYPLSRSLYIYVNTDKATESPAVKGYVDFYLNAGLSSLVSEVGYVQLPDDRIAATQDAWSGAGV